ncbi:hypothetical protein N0V82_008101 [Gnomoniopsis sp. IMI 355080]|nr:hypothetical protein N0V82_008101 [Gnomoniopsis sp. IMI 355080]
MEHRQYLVPTGVPHGSSSLTRPHAGSLGLPSDFSGCLKSDFDRDVVMTDAPRLISTRIRQASQFYNHRVGPMVEPALVVAADGLKHGIKRAADFAISRPFAKAAQAYIETRHSTDDGLVIKRFKRLPIARRKKTTLARLTNTLPVQLLKQLPAKEFDWSTDPLKHLGARDHQRARDFMESIVRGMKNSDYVYFPDIHHILEMDALPESAKSLLEQHGRQPGLSVLLHNHMITFFEKNDTETFRQSGFDLLSKLNDLFSVHHHTYYNGGRIPSYKMLHIKPTGPIEIPYEEHGTLAHYERLKVLNCIKTVQFILTERNCFNQTFPVHTFAGMMADLDAIRKDQLPPSYIDWPGKDQLHMPGRYPENEMENLLFETINFNDYQIDRMWDEWHPSPSKDVTIADYRTPLRRAMQKNELVRDGRGQPQPRKGALKKKSTDWKAIEKRCELEIIEDADKRLDINMATPEKRGASFIDSPIAFYIPSTNVPIHQAKSQKHEAPLTPMLPRFAPRATLIDPIQSSEAVQPNETMQPDEVAQPIEDTQTTRLVQPLQIVEDRQTSVLHNVNDELIQPGVVAQHTGVTQSRDVIQSAENAPQATEVIPSAGIVQEATNVVHAPEVTQSTNQEAQTMERMVPQTTVPQSAWGKSIWRVTAPRSEVNPSLKRSKTVDELLDEDGPFGKPGLMRLSEEKEIDIALQQQLIEEAEFRKQQEVQASIKRKLEEDRRKEEEQRRIEEEKRRKAEEERQHREKEERLAELNRLREEDERIAQTGQLRQPHRPFIPELTNEWAQKVQATLRARSNAELAKTPEGTPLQRKDFETVVPQNQWLNDEIVNGTLSHLNNYINQKAGIKNTRVQTPKSQLLNSFMGKSLNEGKPITERMMRRLGVKKENFLEIETIFIPICRGLHWTIVVLRPKHRQIYHLDSLQPAGQKDLKDKALAFVHQFLGSAFIEDEWKTMSMLTPQQHNADDCGMHTITNGICLGLGIDPMSAYNNGMIALQRQRVAAILLNEGFKGDFTLDGL